MSSFALLRLARPVMGAFAAMGILWGTVAAALPDLKAMLGVGEAGLGGLLFFSPFASMAVMLLAPRIGAALGRHALVLAAIVMAAATALPGQANTVWLFPVAMMCCGGATGLVDILINARAVQIEVRHDVRLLNLAHASYSFGYAGGAVLTGVLRARMWPPGELMAVMALVAIAFALLALERDGTIHGLRPVNGTPRDDPRRLLPLIGGAIVIAAYLAETSAQNWGALHIEKSLGGSPAEGAFGPAVIALTMGLTRIAGQGFVQRRNPFILLKLGAITAAAGGCVVALAPSPGVAYAGFIIMGIGSAVLAPTAFSLVGHHAAPEMRARAVARATFLGYSAYFFGPPLFGVVAGALSLRASFLLATVLVLAVLPLAGTFARVAMRPDPDHGRTEA